MVDAINRHFDDLMPRGAIFVFMTILIISFVMMPIPICRSPRRRISKGFAAFPHWQ
jgi:hypothetical protein